MTVPSLSDDMPYGLLRFVQEHAPARLDAIAEERATHVAALIALDAEAADLRRLRDVCVSLPKPAGQLERRVPA